MGVKSSQQNITTSNPLPSSTANVVISNTPSDSVISSRAAIQTSASIANDRATTLPGTDAFPAPKKDCGSISKDNVIRENYFDNNSTSSKRHASLQSPSEINRETYQMKNMTDSATQLRPSGNFALLEDINFTLFAQEDENQQILNNDFHYLINVNPANGDCYRVKVGYHIDDIFLIL